MKRTREERKGELAPIYQDLTGGKVGYGVSTLIRKTFQGCKSQKGNTGGSGNDRGDLSIEPCMKGEDGT